MVGRHPTDTHSSLVDYHHPDHSSRAPIASHRMRNSLAHELLRLLFRHVVPEFRIYVAVASVCGGGMGIPPNAKHIGRQKGLRSMLQPIILDLPLLFRTGPFHDKNSHYTGHLTRRHTSVTRCSPNTRAPFVVSVFLLSGRWDACSTAGLHFKSILLNILRVVSSFVIRAHFSIPIIQ